MCIQLRDIARFQPTVLEKYRIAGILNGIETGTFQSEWYYPKQLNFLLCLIFLFYWVEDVPVLIDFYLYGPVPPKMMPFTFGDNQFRAVSQQPFSVQYQVVTCHLTLSGSYVYWHLFDYPLFPHGNLNCYNWPFC